MSPETREALLVSFIQKFGQPHQGIEMQTSNPMPMMAFDTAGSIRKELQDSFRGPRSRRDKERNTGKGGKIDFGSMDNGRSSRFKFKRTHVKRKASEISPETTRAANVINSCVPARGQRDTELGSNIGSRVNSRTKWW